MQNQRQSIGHKKLPFKMLVESKMEKYRHDSFWEKEPETIAWIDSFSDGDLFFDIGANIGIYSLYCAAIHQKSNVVAFEPATHNADRLVENIILNGFNRNDRVRLYRSCISDVDGRFDFISPSIEIGSSGGQVAAIPGQYPSRSIDSIIMYSFDVPVPNHIKIDIDGQEIRVVRGMRKTLQDDRLKSVLIEIDLLSGHRDEILHRMKESGFTRDNRINKMIPHSWQRRAIEEIPVENIVFTRP